MDGDSFGVNGTPVGIFEESHKKALRSFLKSTDGGRLEANIRLEFLSNLTHKSSKWKLSDEQLGRLLILAYLPKSDGAWAIALRLLDAAGDWSLLDGGHGAQLLAMYMLAGGLLGASH